VGTRPERRGRGCTVALSLLLAFALAAPLARADAPPAQSAAPAAAPAIAPLHEPLERWPQSALGVRSGGKVHRFQVWIADTYARREQGLMWVKQLPPDRGMLFLFEQPQLASFWMKNTYVPLDILFVAPDGRVIRIAENAKPQSLDAISSLGYVTGVLELAGGTAKKLALRAGDVVVHPAFARR
jgi:uncharacterized membrane protein (UPF0127 family)